MTNDTAAQPDPTLAVAELQLAMLGELAEMAMVVSRAYADASVAAAEAVKIILADEVWQPETGRARALAGAKDAADAFQKVCRVVRLTLMLAKTTAEWVRDARAGTCSRRVPSKKNAGVPAGPCPERPETEVRRCEKDRERPDVERPDRLPCGTFRETVERICADLGVAPDWARWEFKEPDTEDRPTELIPGTDPHPPPRGVGGAAEFSSAPQLVATPERIGQGVAVHHELQ